MNRIYFSGNALREIRQGFLLSTFTGEAMAFTGLNVTAGVDLGVHDGPTDIHLRATQAVLTDNVAVMEELDLQWAISSPLGALGWVLERSPWWEQVDEVSGSRSWQLRAAPAPHFLGATTVAAESCDASDCSMRPDPWAGQRWNDVHGLGDMRAVIDAPASVTLTVEQPGDLPSVPVLMCLHVERLGALESGEVRLGDWVADLAGAAGHDRRAPDMARRLGGRPARGEVQVPCGHRGRAAWCAWLLPRRTDPSRIRASWDPSQTPLYAADWPRYGDLKASADG